jgi:glycerophosphoryl diester phosphodiesterase
MVFKLNKKWYKMARKHEMSVNAWTVNKEGDMKSMFKLGVDQLTTDNPLEARALMEEMKVTELK